MAKEVTSRFNEAVLPVQWQERRQLMPEQRLMLAILEDALFLVSRARRQSVREERLYVEARDWFLASDDDAPCTFANVCRGLGIEPDAARRNIVKRFLSRAPAPFRRRRHEIGRFLYGRKTTPRVTG
jgi:hypothetical protein